LPSSFRQAHQRFFVRTDVDAKAGSSRCITDPSSITFRNEEELLAGSADPEKAYREDILPRKLDLYEEYVRTRTFWGDIRIILKTIWVVVWPGAGKRGAGSEEHGARSGE
jgi:lipopolysaccharide/colanic/teichoic acid biosynthesis glycosyltransferase